MIFSELVNKRFSCRNFSGEPVLRSDIESCLAMARLAPSACNSQPWYFIVVDDPGLKNNLATTAFSGIYSSNSFAGQAPVLIVTTRHQPLSPAIIVGHFKKTDFSLIDLGTAVDHLVLAATEIGLATCYLGWFHEKNTRNLLKIPGRLKVEFILALGYPAADTVPVKNRKPLNEITRFNNDI